MRILCNIVLVCSILYLPWWATALCVITSVVLVPGFYEAIIYGIAFDVLYGTQFGWNGFVFLGTVFSAVIVSVIGLARNRLAF